MFALIVPGAGITKDYDYEDLTDRKGSGEGAKSESKKESGDIQDYPEFKGFYTKSLTRAF